MAMEQPQAFEPRPGLQSGANYGYGPDAYGLKYGYRYGASYGAVPSGLSLGEFLTVVNRRRWPVLGVVVAITLAATLVGLLKNETYTAAASIIIEPQENELLGLQHVTQTLSVDEASIETETKYIRSHENLARVVDLLDLEANPTLIFPGGWPQAQSNVLTWLLPSNLLVEDGQADSPEDAEEADEEQFRLEAIAKLREALTVSQLGDSSILDIEFDGRDPVHAALIANGVARAYIEGQLDRKLSDLEYAKTWLADRVEELRQRVVASEEAIQRYRSEHNLVEDQGGTFDAQQIARLTTEMIGVRADRTAAEAKLRKVRELVGSGNYQALDDALSSPLLTSLRQEELGLMRRKAEMSQVYGDQHPKFQQLRTEEQEVRGRIRLELDEAVRSLENEVELARKREGAFRESLEEARGEASGRSNLTSQAEVRLRELEREASADRALFESFLVRLKQLEEQQGISQADARIVSPAEVPESTSSPSALLFAFVGFSSSLALGSILALFLEQQDTSLRSTKQIKALFGLHALGIVPRIFAGREDGRTLHDYLVKNPGSAYAESFRSLYALMRGVNGERPPKALLVTSALPGEGKTTLSASLAISAAQLGQSVLLIDLDLRRPAIADYFGLDRKGGILQLAEGGSFEDAVQRVDGVDVLTAFEGCVNPTEFLTSRFLQELLWKARRGYDWVIIDTPPVLGMADTKMLAPSVDAVLVTVRWQVAKRDAVQSALDELGTVSAEVIGAVLNEVDVRRHASYAYGDAAQFHKTYGKYYHR